MGRRRTFDWDEAVRLRRQGLPLKAIGDLLGVSAQSIRMATDPEARERENADRRTRLYRETCPDCGGPRNHYNARCLSCSHKAKVTSVRPDTLRCMVCREWKPDTEFAGDRSRPHRRHRRTECRSCHAASKRAWRQRNSEHARAYDREYKRRRRAGAA